MDLKDEKEIIQQGTPRFEMGSNDMNMKLWGESMKGGIIIIFLNGF